MWLNKPLRDKKVGLGRKAVDDQIGARGKYPDFNIFVGIGRIVYSDFFFIDNFLPQL